MCQPSSEDIGCAGGVHVDGKIGDPITEEEENEGEASPEESVRNAVNVFFKLRSSY